MYVEYGGFEMNKQELAKEVVKLWLKEGKKINTEEILKVCLFNTYIEKNSRGLFLCYIC